MTQPESNSKPRRRTRGAWLVALCALSIVTGSGLIGGCSSPIPRRDPTGEMFPSVVGESLQGKKVQIPEAFSGEPVLLLVGYKQNTQFDLDRWLLGLTQLGLDVEVREIPTIAGLVPGMIGTWIDGGMRRGIPSEDWGAVITVYGDAKKIQRVTGTENAMPGRILLLDAEGRIAYFHDRGYSVGALKRLEAVLEERTAPSRE